MASDALARRRRERAALLDDARTFASELDPGLGVHAVVVVGSVARGDFNLWSDIDVVIVADRLPARLLDRLAAVGQRPRVQPIPWTPEEWARQRARGNPIVTESLEHGVWLISPDDERQECPENAEWLLAVLGFLAGLLLAVNGLTGVLLPVLDDAIGALLSLLGGVGGLSRRLDRRVAACRLLGRRDGFLGRLDR